jgi:hypothetical protein
MNSSYSNAGGYDASEMNALLEEHFIMGLINAIGNYVYPVTRNLSDKGSFSWHIHNVWLPTEYEVFGTHSYSESQSGDIVNIPLYTEYSDYRIKTGSNNYWWLSSPSAFDSSFFCLVSSSGFAYDGFASDMFGVSPCFCIF